MKFKIIHEIRVVPRRTVCLSSLGRQNPGRKDFFISEKYETAGQENEHDGLQEVYQTVFYAP